MQQHFISEMKIDAIIEQMVAVEESLKKYDHDLEDEDSVASRMRRKKKEIKERRERRTRRILKEKELEG